MNRAVRKSEQGVTLIELLAVIVILAIIAAIAIPVMTTAIEEMRSRAFVANAKQMRESAYFDLKARLMNLDGNGEHEVTYEELIVDGYLEPFLDPDTREIFREDQVPKANQSYVRFKRAPDGGVDTYIYLKGHKRQIGTESEPFLVDSLITDHVQNIPRNN